MKEGDNLGPFFYGFDTYYLLLVVPALLLSIYAQYQVSATFQRYAAVPNSRRITGREAAAQLLRIYGIYDITLAHTSGNLSDHFDPRRRVVRLSDATDQSYSVAAVGVAAHEIGHVIQYQQGYFPIKLRNAILPIAQIGSSAAIPLFLLGFLFSNALLAKAGILLYLGVVVFQLVTLPVELNASHRALVALRDNGLLTQEEQPMAKKVLRAAALTYIASALMGIAQLLRFMMMTRRRN